MSAVVCGKRSYFFEDTTSSSPPASKRTCFSSNSPARISPPRSNTVRLLSAAHLDHLAALFPDMDKQVAFFVSFTFIFLLLLLKFNLICSMLFLFCGFFFMLV